MKKFIWIALALVMAPIALVAEFGVGAAALYKSPVLLGQDIDLEDHNVDQFSFGGDLRWKIGWFQASGLIVYSAGEVDSLNAYLDAGVALDVAIVRLSLGAGPNFSNNFGQDHPIQAGLNAKLGADILFGPISLGLTYIMALDIGKDVVVHSNVGLLGAQIIFWLE